MEIVLMVDNVLKARGLIVYEPRRLIERENGNVVVGHKRTNIPWWVVVKTSESITNYYRTLIERDINPLGIENLGRNYEKYNHLVFKLQAPLWGSHITVCSGREEVKTEYQHNWKKYEGKVIEFEYSPEVYRNWNFFCIPVRSTFLEDLRDELGLPKIITREKHPVPGFNFHLTVGRIV
jgi:hypothetical protein